MTDMCYAIEKIKEEAAIFATIKTCRKHRIPETEILNEIREEFGLSETEAEAFFHQSKENALASRRANPVDKKLKTCPMF